MPHWSGASFLFLFSFVHKSCSLSIRWILTKITWIPSVALDDLFLCCLNFETLSRTLNSSSSQTVFELFGTHRSSIGRANWVIISKRVHYNYNWLKTSTIDTIDEHENSSNCSVHPHPETNDIKHKSCTSYWDTATSLSSAYKKTFRRKHIEQVNDEFLSKPLNSEEKTKSIHFHRIYWNNVNYNENIDDQLNCEQDIFLLFWIIWMIDNKSDQKVSSGEWIDLVLLV